MIQQIQVPEHRNADNQDLARRVTNYLLNDTPIGFACCEFARTTE